LATLFQELQSATPELYHTAAEEQEMYGMKYWAISREIKAIISQVTWASVQGTESDITPAAFIFALN
jgi:hypothetical protein